MIAVLYDSRANARKPPRWYTKDGEVMRMTNVEMFALMIAVASLVLTVYFGMKR